MKLTKLIERCKAALQESFQCDFEVNDYDGRLSVSLTIDTNDGSIDILYIRKGYKEDVEVIVNHNDSDHDSPNLEGFLEKELFGCVDWNAVEEYWRDWNLDEYQRNGFASEADFWKWKEG